MGGVKDGAALVVALFHWPTGSRAL